MKVIYTKILLFEGVSVELTIDLDSVEKGNPAARVAERIASGYPNTPHAHLHCKLYREEKINCNEFVQRTETGLQMYLAGMQRKN